MTHGPHFRTTVSWTDARPTMASLRFEALEEGVKVNATKLRILSACSKNSMAFIAGFREELLHGVPKLLAGFPDAFPSGAVLARTACAVAPVNTACVDHKGCAVAVRGGCGACALPDVVLLVPVQLWAKWATRPRSPGSSSPPLSAHSLT